MKITDNGPTRSQSKPPHGLPLPLPVERALGKLGHDIALARRRRHISQASLAERIGSSLSTVRRMEKGDVKVPIHFIARTLYVFGELAAFTNLLDTAHDDIGLTMMDDSLVQRVHDKPGKNKTGAL